jgi:dephospho-CoA kinase
MRLIGLTGEIGVGKTYVTGIFEQLNTPVICADKIVRDLLTNDLEVIAAVKKYFNITDVISNLKVIRKQVFANKKHKIFLERLLHPKVITEIKQQIDKLTKSKKKHPYCVIAIPMIQKICRLFVLINIEKIILIQCERNLQISRVMHRDKISKSQVMQIINNQFPATVSQDLVNYRLDSNDFKNLYQQVIDCHEDILDM